jgi:hypothetical protein
MARVLVMSQASETYMAWNTAGRVDGVLVQGKEDNADWLRATSCVPASPSLGNWGKHQEPLGPP